MVRKRSRKDLEIDRATAGDRLSDADLATAVVTFPEKARKVPLNMRIEPELVELSRRIAEARHLDGYTQLLRLYIREGLERDRALLGGGQERKRKK
jgi:hypothetical protein